MIRKAESQEEVEVANWLVFRNYVAEGYWENDAHKYLIENQWLRTPYRDVFVATRKQEIVGTVSVIRDSKAGLPSDAFQPLRVDHFRRSGDRLGEGSALAVEKNRPELRNLSLYLLACYMQYSFYCASIDRLIQACRRNHADFYADVLRFEKIGGVVYNSYARWPGQLLSLDLIDAHQILSDYYEENGMDRRNLYRFLMVDEHPNIRFPHSAMLDRPRRYDWIAHARHRQLTGHKQQIGRPGESRLVASIAVRA